MGIPRERSCSPATGTGGAGLPPHDAAGSRFPRMDPAGVGNVSAAPGQPSSSRPRPLARNSSNGCGGQW